MLNNLDLACPFVLVNPELEPDPEERKNTLGLLLSAVDDVSTEFYVSFTDNTRSRLPADALFILKPLEEMQQFLIDYGADLPFAELKPLTLLVLTLRHANGDRPWHALKVAANNPVIQPLCLDLLSDSIRIGQAQHRSR